MSLKQLSSHDASFLFMETPNNHTHVMCIHIYDPSTSPKGSVRFKDIIRHIDDRIDNSPIFKRRLMRVPLSLDLPYWVEDEHFDIEFHMSHSRLPEPGDWRQLCIHMARYYSKPMDLNRPLWDMQVVEGLDRIDGLPEGAFAIATRVHHCAVDGQSGRYFFAAISDRDPDGNPVIEGPIDVPELGDTPGTFSIVQRAAVNLMTSPAGLARTAFQYVPAITRSIQELVLPTEEPEAPSRIHGSIQKCHRTRCSTASLSASPI